MRYIRFPWYKISPEYSNYDDYGDRLSSEILESIPSPGTLGPLGNILVTGALVFALRWPLFDWYDANIASLFLVAALSSPHTWIWTRRQQTTQCHGGSGPCQPPWRTSPSPPCPMCPTCQGSVGGRDRLLRIPPVCQIFHLLSLTLLTLCWMTNLCATFPTWGCRQPTRRVDNGRRERERQTDSSNHKEMWHETMKLLDPIWCVVIPISTEICQRCHKIHSKP